MSAFLCSQEHIEALAQGAASLGVIYTHEGRTIKCSEQFRHVCSMLLAENLRSVKYRYSHNADARQEFDANAADFGPWREYTGPHTSPAAVLKLAECLDYQACETPDYMQTECRAFYNAVCSAIAEPKARLSLSNTADYARTPWGL